MPEGLTPHGLRHSCASLAISAGANVKVVQRMLGHASAAMTSTSTAICLMTTLRRWPTRWARPSMPRPARGQLRYGLVDRGR
nr:tyrosine-type recombinase/integrase [Mycolicibacterium sphagni]